MRIKVFGIFLGAIALVLLASLSPSFMTPRAIAADPAAVAPSHILFVASDYGAVGDGKTLNTAALQALIDRIASSGGGTLDVPKGSFLSGALFFKQGVNLRIETDGVLLGSTRPSDYPQVDTRWEGVERKWTSAFINFDHMTNVQVDGDGTINGQGDIWMGGGGRGGRRGGAATQGSGPGGAQGLDGAATRPAGAGRGRGGFPATRPATRPGGFAGGGRGPANAPGVGRPRLICFSNCTNVRISDLHLTKQAVWCLHILYSQHVVAENLHIDAVARIPSSDGMDIDSSDDVQVSHCDIACNDDDIAIKSGKDEDGLRVNRPSQNITISNCTIGVGAGIAMGSEVSGGIRNVTIERCILNNTDSAARIKSQPSRGGVIENITYRDITLNNVRWAIDFNLAWRMVNPLPPAPVLTIARNIHLINLHGTARMGGNIDGLPDGPFQDITFTNCDIAAQTGLDIRSAPKVDLAGLKLTVQQGEAITYNATQPAN
jgi:polygalacturonase